MLFGTQITQIERIYTNFFNHKLVTLKPLFYELEYTINSTLTYMTYMLKIRCDTS